MRIPKVFLNISALMLCFVFLYSISSDYWVYAKNDNISGKIYSFDEKDDYDLTNAKSVSDTKNNTYGKVSISGSLSSDGMKDGIPSYYVSDGSVSFTYAYSDTLLNAVEEEWHLTDESKKEVLGIKLNSKINKGALIFQTSKDGQTWVNDFVQTNVFEDKPIQRGAFYTTKGVQLANGCFYRLIIVYKTGRDTGEREGLLKTKVYEYKKYVEVYEWYLHDDSSSKQEDSILSKNLGTLTNTGKDNGYSGTNEIGIKDPHYGWTLGQFFVSGYTRETKSDAGNPVFLKNVGDQITLWFNLKQDIDRLNGDEIISISDDYNGYDQYFQTAKIDMGRGTLIIRYTDEKGIKHDPEIYTNYLEANATTSADTIVKLFEEGDYEVALDYEIKKTPRKVGNVEVVPEYYNYRLYFEFSVRNGNCMVYPFDITTGDELSDESITPNGFKLDMARSRYLTIDVKRAVVTQGATGYVEDVRFNRPAKDGDSYTDEGIYTFSVHNLYTGESTTKTIYVGNSDVLSALSLNKLGVNELNELLAKGAVLGEDGSIEMPQQNNAEQQEEIIDQESEEPASEEPEETNNSPEIEPPSAPESVPNDSRNKSIIPIIGVICAVVLFGVVMFLKKKKQ